VPERVCFEIRLRVLAPVPSTVPAT
jgi:hypothetical protein